MAERLSPAELASALAALLEEDMYLYGRLVARLESQEGMPDFLLHTEDGAVYRINVTLIKDPLHG